MLSRSVNSASFARSARLASQNLRRVRHAQNSVRFYAQSATDGSTKATKAKKFSLTKILFKLTLLTGFVYGVGATAALIYEPLQDKYIETFPYGEEVMDKLDYTWKHKQEIKKEIQDFDYQNFYDNKFAQFASSVNNTAAKLGLDDYINIPHKGVEAKPATIITKPKKEDQFLILSNSDPSSKKVQLPLISINSVDDTVNTLVSELNSLITEFNSSKLSDNSTAIMNKINKSLDTLSKNFEPSTKDIEEFKNLKLKQLELEFAKEKTKLTSELTNTLQQTKEELIKKHNEKLAKESDEIRKALALEYDAKLKQQEIELIKKFDKSVTSKIESERNDKLKDLEGLSQRIESVEKFELELSEVASTYTTFKEIRKSISKISSLLNSNVSSNIRGENLVNEINNLKDLTKPLDNGLIDETIDSFPTNTELLKNGGVLTQSQILTRWELLVPELRKVSLLPENPGILGYASSSLFSKFLWSKNGIPTTGKDQFLGNDVESVIARVNNYLQKNQLDNAVEEVTSLKGVARDLVNDWLTDTRRKLQIQFLVDIISTEVNVSA